MNSIECIYPDCPENAIAKVSWTVRRRGDILGVTRTVCLEHTAKLTRSIVNEPLCTMVHHRPL